VVVVEVGVWAGELGGGYGCVYGYCEDANKRQLRAELVEAANEEGDGGEGGDNCCCCGHDGRGVVDSGGRISAKKMSESSCN